MTENSCDEFNDKVLRGSQGSIFHLEIVRMSMLEVIDHYPDHLMLSADMNGDTEFASEEKVVLILGNESLGLPNEVKNKTKTISIQTEKIESLNLAVAGSILMYQLSK